MARTTSISFPNMIDVSRNTISVLEDNSSIVNRTRLLMLSDPTEMYNDPTFGVGLKKYLWQYNTDNTKAILQDNIKEQLREREPCVDSDETQFADGLLFTGSGQPEEVDPSQLKLTVGLRTIYEDEISVSLNSSDLQTVVDTMNKHYSEITKS